MGPGVPTPLATRGEPQVPDAFYQIKKILAKVITVWILENTGKYSTCAEFNRDFPKLTIFGISKLIFSYFFIQSFWNLI